MWAKIIILNIVVAVQSWPTLKLNIFNHSVKVIESDYVGFNITNLKSGGRVMYYDIKKDNLKLWSNVVIHLESKKDEYATEFLNKTLDLCKLISSRRYEPIVYILYQGLVERFPTLPKNCPLKKRLYIASFENYETDKLPPIWPDTTIRIIVTHYTYEKNSLKLLLNFTLYVKQQKK